MGPRMTVQITEQEGITVGLVTEMISVAERDGIVVKDIDSDWGDSGGNMREVTWWRNYFGKYVWDGD